LPKAGNWLGEIDSAASLAVYNIRVEFFLDTYAQATCARLDLNLSAHGVVDAITLNAQYLQLSSYVNASGPTLLGGMAGLGFFRRGSNILNVRVLNPMPRLRVVGLYVNGAVQVTLAFMKLARSPSTCILTDSHACCA
jgi:hypothetical protein